MYRYNVFTGTFDIVGGGGSAGGSDTQVQYNNAGAFAGDAGLTYNASTDRLTIAGGIAAPSMRPASDSTTALQLQNAAGTAVVTVDTTNQRVGIGATPISNFGVAQNSVSGPQGISITGKSAVFPDTSTSGIIFTLGFNANNNRQLWLSDSSQFNDGARSSFRYIVGFETPIIDGISNDGAATRNINLCPSSRVGVGHPVATAQASITALLDIAASTTARASLRIRSGTAPTSPNDGDIWFNGTAFQCHIGGVTRTFTVT